MASGPIPAAAAGVPLKVKAMSDRVSDNSSLAVAAEMVRKALAFGATHPKPEDRAAVAAALTAEAIATVRQEAISDAS